MANRIVPDADFLRMRIQLSLAFTPSGPVDNRDLFAGRIQQIGQVISAVGQSGQHVVLFGERGVGKTSLASLVNDFWIAFAKSSALVFAPRENCDPDDDYASIWSNIAEQIGDLYAKHDHPQPTSDAWNEVFDLIRDGGATPHVVRRFLDLSGETYIIVIDEFDQIKDPETAQLFASTIKALSDHLINATIILVGVADTVDDLIEEHASIDRALVQVRMPRMSRAELRDVITRGYDDVGLSIEPGVLDRMSGLAQGLPHYAHRFGQESGYAAAGRGSYSVEHTDVDTAIRAAIELTAESIQVPYHAATTSNRAVHLFEKVLLACALTPVDDFGFFSAGSVREPLEVVAGKRYEIPQYIKHLGKFATQQRGPVLLTVGEDRRRRYRFVNPLLRPYTILRGIEQGLVSEDAVRELEAYQDREPPADGEQQRML